MPIVDNQIKLDFKDVLIRPKRSTIKSRADVSCVLTFYCLVTTMEVDGCVFKLIAFTLTYYSLLFTFVRNDNQEHLFATVSKGVAVIDCIQCTFSIVPTLIFYR